MANLNLRQLVTEPETHQKIVGGFDGDYSLGVVNEDPPTLLLRVEGSDLQRFPTRVSLRGQDVDVRVEGSYRRPSRLPLGVPST